MRSLEEQLLHLKSDIEKAKTEKAQLEGSLKVLQDELKSKFSCKTEAEAKRKLASMRKELDNKQAELEKRLDAFDREHKEQHG